MDVISPQIRARDEQVRGEIKALLKEYQADIPPPEPKKEEETKKTAEKKVEEEKPETEKKSEKENAEKSISDDKKTEEKKRDRSNSRSKARSKSREVSQKKGTRSRSKSSRRKRSRSKERSRSRRSRSRNRDRTRETTRDRSRERERRRRSLERRKDEEEMIERRRLERKMKEKNSAYQERLNVWEARERRKAREWERIESKDNDRRRQMAKEARRLRDFLESYDDEKDDRKFYFGSGSAFAKRNASRKKELEDDAKDKKKEEGEIAMLHQKLAGEGHPDPNGAIAKVIKEAEEIWKPFIKPDVRIKKGSRRDSTSSTEAEESEESSDGSGHESDDEPLVAQLMKEESNQKQAHHTSDEDDEDGVEMDLGEGPPPPEAPPISLPALSIPKASDSPTTRKKSNRNVPSIFNEEEPSEDPSLPGARKRKRETPKPREILDADEKRRAVKALIERIPTDKGPLFAYPMKWEYLGNNLMEKRISPWIKKKLNEIIGEDEPTLIVFISDKLASECKPEQILSEIRVVLDEEAEVFVIKLWRLLVYETEARAEGISA